MRRVLLTVAALLLVSVDGWAQSCDGCGIGYRPSSLSSSGGTLTGPLLLPNGSVSAPSLAWATDSQLGLYKNGQGFNLASGGTQYSIWALTTLTFLNNSAPTVIFNNDTTITRGGAADTVQFGANAATASAQTLKSANSTGANVAGSNFTIRAGAGTSGNATGGQLILGGGANAGSGERGAVQIEDGGTQPTCAAGIRGSLWYEAGGAGVADKFEICAKQAAGDTYAWRTAATIP